MLFKRVIFDLAVDGVADSMTEYEFFHHRDANAAATKTSLGWQLSANTIGSPTIRVAKRSTTQHEVEQKRACIAATS